MNLRQKFPHGNLKLISATFYKVQIRCDHLESRSSRINVKQHDYQKKAIGIDDFKALQNLSVRGPYPS